MENLKYTIHFTKADGGSASLSIGDGQPGLTSEQVGEAVTKMAPAINGDKYTVVDVSVTSETTIWQNQS